MSEGKCPECKAPVGGTGYRLAAGNVHAPEMDGAATPAFHNDAMFDINNIIVD